MSFAAAHQRTLAELARVQHERDELARFVERLRAALADEIEPPDARLDAEEDAAYAQAVARMQEAEAREDRAGAAASVPLETSPAWREFHAHLDACAQCAGNPFNHCPTGQALIARMGKP